MKEFFDKIIDILFRIGKKLDGISEQIYDQTHIKLDLKIILGSIIAIIIVFILVKSTLGYLWSQL